MRLRPCLSADELALVDVWYDGWRSTGLTRPVVTPHVQGRGLGLVLFDAAQRAMPDGFWLSTQVESQSALAFYVRRGMLVDTRDRGLGQGTIAYVAGPLS